MMARWVWREMRTKGCGSGRVGSVEECRRAVRGRYEGGREDVSSRSSSSLRSCDSCRPRGLALGASKASGRSGGIAGLRRREDAVAGCGLGLRPTVTASTCVRRVVEAGLEAPSKRGVRRRVRG